MSAAALTLVEPAQDFGPKNQNLPKSLQRVICEVISAKQEQDRWIKLVERLQDATLRYYDVDIQHLWNNNNILLQAVPGNTYPTSDGGSEYFPDYINDYPVFNAFAQIRQAKLSEPDIGIDFQPINPKRTKDREAARAAEAIRLMSDLDQDPHETVARKVYFTDMGGRCITYKELCDDDSVFGTGPNGEPRRKIIWHIGGCLEWEVPLFASSRKEMLYAFKYSDPDLDAAKTDYPWIASKLQSGQMCLQEGAYSRILRLGVIQAVQARQYDWQIGNSLTHLITKGDCWLRTGAFVNKEDVYRDDKGDSETPSTAVVSMAGTGGVARRAKIIKEKIEEVYPDGLHAVIVGRQYAQSWNESMDDCLSILHSQPGRGMTRRPGLKPLVAVQDRINQTLNYIAQSNDTGAPSIWINSQICDFASTSKHVARPWALRDLDELDPKTPIKDYAVYREEQEDVPAGFLKFFEVLQALAQFQVFCPPSIFGTGSPDNTTAEGMEQAARQALGILGSYRTRVIRSMAEDYTQIALLVSRDKDFPDEIVVPQGPDATRTSIVRKEALQRGNFRAFPDKDSGFPESTASKRQALERLVMLIGQTPLGAQVFGSPSNIAEMVRLQGSNLVVPEAQAWNKQSREIEQLLHSRPTIMDPDILALLEGGASVPTITDAIFEKIQQAQAAAAQAAEIQDAGAKIAASEAGINEPPKPAVAPLPPLKDILARIAKSSVPVRLFDVHIFEAAACADWLSSDECSNEETIGNSETDDGEPIPNTAGVLNVTLHCFEHVIAKPIIPPPVGGALPPQGSPPKLPPGPPGV